MMRLPPLALASRMPDDWQLEHLSSTPRARRATFCASYSFGVPTVYPVIALQVPLSARRAASKLKCLEAANAFDERLADWSAVGRCRVGASPITSHRSQLVPSEAVLGTSSQGRLGGAPRLSGCASPVERVDE